MVVADIAMGENVIAEELAAANKMRFRAPIRIGEVTIHPGDLALGDRDGMVILPKDRAEEIVAAAESASRSTSARTSSSDASGRLNAVATPAPAPAERAPSLA